MKKQLILICLITILGIGYTPAQMSYEPDERINITVYEKISPAIVAIDAQVPDGVSAGTGCIVIKIDSKKPLKTVSFGDSEEVKVGQKVLSIGNPFGFSNTLTQGIISRIDYVKNRFQTDAAINPGCSGGPLLNSTGEVIGISQSIYNPDHNISNIGIGFAIPSNEAIKFIATVKK